MAADGKPIRTINRALRRKILYMLGPRGPVAQGIEQQPSKLKVAGSNPAGVANKIRYLMAIWLSKSSHIIDLGI